MSGRKLTIPPPQAAVPGALWLGSPSPEAPNQDSYALPIILPHVFLFGQVSQECLQSRCLIFSSIIEMLHDFWGICFSGLQVPLLAISNLLVISHIKQRDDETNQPMSQQVLSAKTHQLFTTSSKNEITLKKLRFSTKAIHFPIENTHTQKQKMHNFDGQLLMCVSKSSKAPHHFDGFVFWWFFFPAKKAAHLLDLLQGVIRCAELLPDMT